MYNTGFALSTLKLNDPFIQLTSNIIIMTSNKESNSVSGIAVLILVILNAVIAKIALIRNENWYWFLVFTIPLLLMAIWDMHKKKHTASRNYRVRRRLRSFVEHEA